MSEISDMMPTVNALLAAGQMPSADQVRRMLFIIDKQDAKIDLLSAALKPFAEDVIDGHIQDDDSVYVSVRHMRDAARALKD